MPPYKQPIPVHVTSEIGTLKRVIIHSPDSGLGKVVPSKAQDWLFEDIVHLDTMRKGEYDYYIKILLYFLDPEKVKGKIKEIDAAANQRNFYKPEHPDYFNSDKVIDPQYLLADILEVTDVKMRLIASICAVERCSYTTQGQLMEMEPKELSKTLISGTLPDKSMIFAPIPNFIFTRDIGIVINDHVLLNKPAKIARTREALLTQYIFYNHPLFADLREKIIELPESEHHFLLPDGEKDNKLVTLEGGDVMMVSANHLLIGCSERTSPYAANQVIKVLFEKNVVEKVTVIWIPKKRDYMHIDTIFTQVKKDVWVLLGTLSKKGEELEKRDVMESLMDGKVTDKLKIVQFIKDKDKPVHFEYLEDLLDDISKHDLQSGKKTRFIYSGNNEFPFGVREQWTDSCNLLAVKEGVVIGYDRNDKTVEAFRNTGFDVICAADLLHAFESGHLSPQTMENTLILLPSAELSRARGGSHCMSMPLFREKI
ncbi:amidinotransferase [Rhodocytophaga rosea]|uniref:arginine deiminase n=1 Tax=Rhodocytophaga rosea TaxID=2704465 RepID=A0A6C0GDA2_9BACT|nr:arginine deiminase family protein [Rhodocytophaga rosea]QHT65979.1 amidinotransferase [Rhodocytophaga rosea]